MKSTLLKKAVILDPNSPYHQQTKDILITKGKIDSIGDNLPPSSNTEVVELENLHVSTGWMDGSVSFGEPGFEERETVSNGCKVAAKSGFTAIALNLDTEPMGDRQATLSFIQNLSASENCQIYPIGCLTVDSKGEHLAELYDLQAQGAIAFGDYNRPISNDLLMKIALQYAQNFDGLIMSFPMNKSIAGKGLVNESEQSIKLGLKPNPILAETLQISRDLAILKYTGGKLHIPTISSKESLELIQNAKKEGLNVSCSVSVHHLALNDEELFSFDSNTKVNPPLRTEEDRLALVAGVKDNSIDFIVSDHRPIDIEEKKVAYNQANYGSIGLETAFGTLNKIFSLEEFLPKITTNVRSRFGLKPLSIQEGEDANLSLFNPEGHNTFTKESIMSSSTNSIFIGKELKGKVYGSYSNTNLTLN